MNKSMPSLLIITVFAAACILSACGKRDIAPKSSFGEVDALQDGKVLISSTSEDDGPAEEGESEDTAVGSTPIKTAKTLEVSDLPADVAAMAGLCDAINMTCVERQQVYDQNDNAFVWQCVDNYVCNYNDRKLEFETITGYREVSPRIVDDIVYSMFGKLREIPKIPDDVLNYADDGQMHMQISNNLKYRFRMDDRGLSKPLVRRATQYSDGSLEMEVALVAWDDEEETVSFIYTMRANTRDTTTTALFDYEITGVRPADKITTDKINGVPFLTSLVQVYGYDSYPKNDVRYNSVDEVLHFSSFKEHVPGMEELNSRISREILEYSNREEDEGRWHQVISYPVITDNYVQFATTFASYPEGGNDPDIRCYNYDKKKTRALELSDAFKICGIKSDALEEKIRGLWDKDGPATPIVSVSCRGFLVRQDGTVDIFYVIETTDASGNPRNRLASYNSGSGRLKVYIKSHEFIPESETDLLKPPLTHGRKDR